MPVQEGSKVSVHYTGTLADGTEFDSSRDRAPLTFVVGDGSMIAGFDAAVRGHEKGERLRVVIPAIEAYGEHLDDLVVELPRDQLPSHIAPEIGMTLQVGTEQGDLDVTLTALSDETLTLDANHPLAGKDLTFDIEIVDAR